MIAPHPSQNDRLAAYLRARPWQWVEMTELGHLVGAWAVHSRMADLRRDYGMIVVNRRIKVDGIVHSSYQYQPPPADNLPVPDLAEPNGEARERSKANGTQPAATPAAGNNLSTMPQDAPGAPDHPDIPLASKSFVGTPATFDSRTMQYIPFPC